MQHDCDADFATVVVAGSPLSAPWRSKALAKAIRKTFGRHTPIQRCQIHKARNILERLPKHLHAAVRTALRQAWEMQDAQKAERLIRNLARRLEQTAPGVSASILEGLHEMLTVIRLGLPQSLRRSLACTNIIENMMGTIRRVSATSNAGAMRRWRCAGPRPAVEGAVPQATAGRSRGGDHVRTVRPCGRPSMSVTALIEKIGRPPA